MYYKNVISYVNLDKQVCMKIKYRSARSTKHVYAFARVSHMFMTAAGVCVCSQKLLETESIHIFQGYIIFLLYKLFISSICKINFKIIFLMKNSF